MLPPQKSNCELHLNEMKIYGLRLVSAATFSISSVRTNNNHNNHFLFILE